jgi:hypothetical protein
MPTIDSWNLPPTWLLWTVDAVLALVVVEGPLLLLWLHRQGRPIAAIASGLLAGAGLAGALRITLHQGSDLAVLACLALAGASHAWELRCWLRPGPAADGHAVRPVSHPPGRSAVAPDRPMAWPRQ